MRKTRFLTRGEAILLAVLVLALTVWLCWPRQAGGQVVVAVSGRTVGRYPLARAATLPVEGANGFHLTVVIADGKAHVEEANCPDLICQHHAPIDRAGTSIICLPGQVSVRVEGGERLGADAISG